VGAIIMTIQLPPRIPDGTRLILEGEPGANGELRVTRRYLVLPGGERFDLMSPVAPPLRLGKPAKASRRRVMPKRRVA
jgi:hypothetical protein